METSYWDKALGVRMSRRRALAATAAASTAAALLAACGSSGSSGSSSGSDKSSLITKPVDTTAQAKHGGVMKDRLHADVPTLDFADGISALNAITSHVSNTFVSFKPGYLKASQNEVVPEIMESWEYSPDGLQITMKLRQGVKWHNKAPVNGRLLDVDDIIFTWDRFTRRSGARASVANAVDPGAPIISLTATDSKTVVMKLKEPIVYALGLFAQTTTGFPILTARETDKNFDARQDMIGTGPFMLTNYTPSLGFTFKRNPDYWDKDHAFPDTVEMPIVTEYATTLAEFKKGDLFSFGSYGSAPKITNEDVLPVKREEPRILVYSGPLGAPQGAGARILSFGWLPAGKSPFQDERVRQAISMAFDRDLYMDTFFNITKFAADGLPVDSRWNTALPSTNEGWWLDPKSKDFGPNARYFQHDPAEAKKLLAAAGFPNGFDTISNYVTTSELPTTKHAQVTDPMIAEIGVRSRVNGIDYSKEYVPKYRDGRGQYEGWVYLTASGGVTGGEAIGVLANEYWSKSGPAFHGFSLTGQNDLAGDPTLDAMIEKARIERDTEKRRAMVFDIQRYLAKPMYAINQPGFGTSFLTAWPALGNFNVFQGSRLNYRLWIDDAKAPLGKT